MKLRKAVFPAAGLGTRFLPATKALPKEMLPIIDKPIVQYAVEEVVASGIEQLLVITARGKGSIEDHFDRAPELEAFLEAKGKDDLRDEVRRIAELVEVSYLRQKTPLGLGHAVGMAATMVGDEPFAVVLPDDVIDAPEPCLAQMARIHQERGGSVIAVMDVPHDRVNQYGIVEGDDQESQTFEIRDLVEKPDPSATSSRSAIIGRYILSPSIFSAIAETPPDHRGEIQITDALRKLRESEPVWAYRFEGTRYDAGDKLGALKATVALALGREDLGPAFADFLRSLELK